MYPLYEAPAREFEYFFSISVSVGVAARQFELTKTSRESPLVAYDCWLAHPTSSDTLPETSLNFAGRGCLLGAVAAR